MAETKNAHDGVVTSITDTDLVMVTGPQGGLRPISFADLMKAVRGGIQVGGRNLLKGTSSLIVNNSTPVYFISNLTKPVSELKKEKALTFSCKYRKTGYSTGNIYVGAIIVSSYYDHKCISVDSLGENGVISVTFTSSLSYPDGGLILYASSQTGLELYDFQLERGNIATDWTLAPEDIASGSWGGVIGYLPITYDLQEKGGAHDRHENACGQAEICADCHLAFGSLDALCEFLGQYSDVCSDERDHDWIGISECYRSMACCGLFQNRPDKSERKHCTQEFNKCGSPSNIQEQSKFDIQRLRYRSFILGHRYSGSSVCRNKALVGFSIADRKEVAYAAD